MGREKLLDHEWGVDPSHRSCLETAKLESVHRKLQLCHAPKNSAPIHVLHRQEVSILDSVAILRFFSCSFTCFVHPAVLFSCQSFLPSLSKWNVRLSNMGVWLRGSESGCYMDVTCGLSEWVWVKNKEKTGRQIPVVGACDTDFGLARKDSSRSEQLLSGL